MGGSTEEGMGGWVVRGWVDECTCGEWKEEWIDEEIHEVDKQSLQRAPGGGC